MRKKIHKASRAERPLKIATNIRLPKPTILQARKRARAAGITLTNYFTLAIHDFNKNYKVAS